MAIVFNIQQGGLGRRLPGRDYVSGLICAILDANLPSGFTTSARSKKFSSIDEVMAAGIIPTGPGNVKILFYHLSEYFRIYGTKTGSIGEIWVYLFSSATGLASADVELLQTAADGEIRQFAVYPGVAFAASLLTTTQAAITALIEKKQPAILIMGGDFSGISLGSLPDIRALNSEFQSVDISQDGSGAGAALAVSEGKSVNGLGTLLGTIAVSKVSDNIGWVRQFNIAGPTEYQQPAISAGAIAGTLFDALNSTQIAELVSKGFIWPRKRQGITGSYYNDSPQAVSANSDFAYIENSRTIQKAIREINTTLVPFINAPLQVNATTGHLSEVTILELESAVFGALEVLARNFEISVNEDSGRLPNNSVFIDPDQNVLTTSQVVITVRIVPIGVQRETIINIGFTPQIA